MERLKIAAAFFAPGVLFYATAVFSWLEPNVFAWEPHSRAALAVCSLFFGGIAAIIAWALPQEVEVRP